MVSLADISVGLGVTTKTLTLPSGVEVTISGLDAEQLAEVAQRYPDFIKIMNDLELARAHERQANPDLSETQIAEKISIDAMPRLLDAGRGAIPFMIAISLAAGKSLDTQDVEEISEVIRGWRMNVRQMAFNAIMELSNPGADITGEGARAQSPLGEGSPQASASEGGSKSE